MPRFVYQRIDGGTKEWTVRTGDNGNQSWLYTDADDQPIDLSAYSARLHVRLQITDVDPVISLASPDRIILGGSAGTIDVNLTPQETAALDYRLEYLWDLELTTDSNEIETIDGGPLIVVGDVTR